MVAIPPPPQGSSGQSPLGKPVTLLRCTVCMIEDQRPVIFQRATVDHGTSIGQDQIVKDLRATFGLILKMLTLPPPLSVIRLSPRIRVASRICFSLLTTMVAWPQLKRICILRLS